MSTQRARKPDTTTFSSTTPPASTSPTASTTLPAKPPSTPLPPPLTPPSSEQKSRTVVKDITREVEKRKVGRGFSTNPWLRFKLSPTDYERWQQQYQEDRFVQEKLRYDYFPFANLFVLRMPGLLHEQLASSIVEVILQQLYSIANGAGPAAHFAQKIKLTGSPTITFDDPQFGRHEPDASFKHADSKYPGVVIEVSYSQKRRDLPRLADDYILGSDAIIRAVVGVDIDYRGKTASVSIWRPRIEVNATGEEELVAHRTLSDQEFRSADGNPIDDPQLGLQLRLEDFALKAFAGEETPLDEEIFIPAKDLFTYLCDAEDSDLKSRGSPVCKGINPGTRKRRRESTPPDQLDEDDEDQFQAEEDRAEERAERDDSSYHGSSGLAA